MNCKHETIRVYEEHVYTAEMVDGKLSKDVTPETVEIIEYVCVECGKTFNTQEEVEATRRINRA